MTDLSDPVAFQQFPTEFELDEDTDDLLIRIAESSETVEPELLRAIIPSRNEFVLYLEQHGLTDYPIAQSILAQYDALPRPALESAAKSDLARTLAQELNLSTEKTAALLDMLAATAVSEINRTGEFSIPGVGRLVKSERPARTVRNPQTGEEIEIEPQATVKFRVAKATKDAVAAAGEATAADLESFRERETES
jgi:DNA-binding protein HU-beta